jgi:hypothetical protein
MNTFDDAVSAKLRIDNHLSHPLRSISWWGLVAITGGTVAESVRHASTVSYAMAGLALAVLFGYFMFRLQLTKLEKSDNLRTVSKRGLIIAGLGIVACLYSITLK